MALFFPYHLSTEGFSNFIIPKKKHHDIRKKIIMTFRLAKKNIMTVIRKKFPLRFVMTKHDTIPNHHIPNLSVIVFFSVSQSCTCTSPEMVERDCY